MNAPNDPARRPANIEDLPAWADQLQWRTTKSGHRTGLINNLYNLQLIFHADPRWICLGWDEAAASSAWLSPPPFYVTYMDPIEERLPRLLSEADYTRLRIWFEQYARISPRLADIAAAVEVAAQHNRYHPLRDFLSNLPLWDWQPRVMTWLRTYMSARPGASSSNEYIDRVGLYWLLSCVARALSAGCKADHVLVLEGSEGVGKSTALSILGGEFYADTAIDITNKDAYLAIRGKWIVELAELDSLMRAESSAAKAFFSSSVDRYRRPFAKDVVEVPRTCVFAGTTNHSDYIRDSSGGRRYWPVEVGEIDLDGLRRDRDQIWAEARMLLREIGRWWPSDAEKPLFRLEQEARQTDDPWESAIVAWLSGRSQASPSEILSGALDRRLHEQDRRDQTRVGIIMQRLGWTRVRRRLNGSPTTLYLPPANGGGK